MKHSTYFRRIGSIDLRVNTPALVYRNGERKISCVNKKIQRRRYDADFLFLKNMLFSLENSITFYQ